MSPSSILGRRAFLAAASRSLCNQANFSILGATAARAAVATVQQSSYGHSGSYNSTNIDHARYGLLAAAGAATAAAVSTNNEENGYLAKCCGIAGVVGAKGDAREYLIEGLTILKNRGYDSAGIATMDDKKPSLVRNHF